jgi:subtilase family serine protease
MVVATVGSAAAFGGSQLSASACGGGKLVINVTQKVVNDADSGVAGNAWAFDSYNRQIQVWQTAPGTFCATVNYEGQFVTIAGPSPQDTGTVSGTLVAAPAYKTRGSVGTFDHGCSVDFVCPGYVSWVSTCFSGASSGDLDWWGWQ